MGFVPVESIKKKKGWDSSSWAQLHWSLPGASQPHPTPTKGRGPKNKERAKEEPARGATKRLPKLHMGHLLAIGEAGEVLR